MDVEIYVRDRFPSPIGEVVSYIMEDFMNSEIYIVSVPYRGSSFLYSLSLHRRSPGSRFPSPIGEVVSYIGRWFVDGVDASTVSVPYRGSSFLYVAGHHGCRVTLGFRPLSGK